MLYYMAFGVPCRIELFFEWVAGMSIQHVCVVRSPYSLLKVHEEGSYLGTGSGPGSVLGGYGDLERG